MGRFKSLNSSIVYEENDLAIVRCVEKDLDIDDNIVGHSHVWYDVNLENGNGDTLESFKTLNEAKKFVKYWVNHA